MSQPRIRRNRALEELSPESPDLDVNRRPGAPFTVERQARESAEHMTQLVHVNTTVDGENIVKKLMLMLTALALAASAPLAHSQPPSMNEASAVSSYSPPVEKHEKKPKKRKSKKGVPASSVMGASISSPAGASAGQ